MNEIFSWSPHDDAFKTVKKSMMLRKIAMLSALTEDDIEKELENRSRVLEWMVLNNIQDYKKVAAIINMYYTSKELLLAKLGV